MEEPLFVKCEPAWPSDTEELSNFEQNAVGPSDNRVKIKEDPHAATAHLNVEEVDIDVVKEPCSDEDEMEEAHNEECDKSGDLSQELFFLLPKSMEDPVFVKCEPPCHSATEEDSNCDAFISSTVDSDDLVKAESKTSILPKVENDSLHPRTEDVKTVENFELVPVSGVVALKQETKSELTEPGLSQEGAFEPLARVKDEIFVEECAVEQLVQSTKDEDNLVNATLLTRGPVNVLDDSCNSSSPNNLQHLMITQKYLVPNSKDRQHCYICSKTFSCRNSLKKHILTHSREKPFCCPICNKTFTQKGTLTAHMLIHTGEKPFQCDVCSKQFSLKRNLTHHLLIHSGEKAHFCKICKVAFSLKHNLNVHMLTHTGEKPHNCDVCSRRFSLKRNLNKHISTHSTEKPYECNLCKKLFALKDGVQNHLQCHSGQRPFSCKLCDNTFSRKYNLSKHMLIHYNVRPYVCNFCDSAFSCKGNLTKNLLTHSLEKSFRCNVCSVSFSLKCNLKRHVLTHFKDRS